MAKRKKDSSFPALSVFNDLQEGTVRGIIAIAFFVISVFLALAAFGGAGILGMEAYGVLTRFFGVGYFLLPILLLALSVSMLRSLSEKMGTSKWVAAVLFLIAGLGLTETLMFGRGGALGAFISTPLVNLVDVYATVLILSSLILISLLIIFNTAFNIDTARALIDSLRGVKKSRRDDEDVPVEMYGDDEEETGPEEANNEEAPAPEPKITKPINTDDEVDYPVPGKIAYGIPYTPPPLSLLEKDKNKPDVGDVKANANLIKRTLQNFGINVEMDEISIGPTVTRYAIKPAEGVRLSKIVALQDNLALALAAKGGIRIEAPIPGKSLVGIEVPNTTKAMLGLGSLVGAKDFAESPKRLLISLGKDITGAPHFADLAKMPHTLIAGTTGSGKSVTIHAVIVSLLYRNSPEQMRFIMIDPKRVELTLYNKIPHLLTPVITDAKKAILALKWAAKEMDRRYDILEAEAVRDIESYHKNVFEPYLEKRKKEGGEPDPEEKQPEAMPYIVVIIDELADIMQTYPRELEASIVRLAQMSRAVGIHLILSTQRPSVNVITGLIKANIPSRIALQVSSQIDSRTILDTGGAEKLLGAGDMLYLSGDMSKPKRIQAPYISETEVKKIASHIAENYEGVPGQELDFSGEKIEGSGVFAGGSIGDDGDDDGMYEEAVQVVMEAGRASTSYLQRKLRVGYARAARLMDMLEERGVIGPADGSKPREVIQGGGGSSAAPSRPDSTEEDF